MVAEREECVRQMKELAKQRQEKLDAVNAASTKGSKPILIPLSNEERKKREEKREQEARIKYREEVAAFSNNHLRARIENYFGSEKPLKRRHSAK